MDHGSLGARFVGDVWNDFAEIDLLKRFQGLLRAFLKLKLCLGKYGSRIAFFVVLFEFCYRSFAFLRGTHLTDESRDVSCFLSLTETPDDHTSG